MEDGVGGAGEARRAVIGRMSDFRIDLDKFYTVKLKSHHPGLRARLGLWLLNSELQCVACYRFGQFADQLRA